MAAGAGARKAQCEGNTLSPKEWVECKVILTGQGGRGVVELSSLVGLGDPLRGETTLVNIGYHASRTRGVDAGG